MGTTTPQQRRDGDLKRREKRTRSAYSRRSVFVSLVHQCVDANDMIMLKALLRRVVHQDPQLECPDANDNNALHRCCILGRAEMAVFLMEAGMALDSRGANGRTPLHFAALSGCSQLVRCLVAACADVTLLDDDGNTAADVSGDTRIGDYLSELQGKHDKMRRMSTVKVTMPSQTRDSGIILDGEDTPETALATLDFNLENILRCTEETDL